MNKKRKNLRKGFFRLTLILSVIAGLIGIIIGLWTAVSYPSSRSGGSLRKELHPEEYKSELPDSSPLPPSQESRMLRLLEEYKSELPNSSPPQSPSDWTYASYSSAGFTIGFSSVWLLYFFIGYVIIPVIRFIKSGFETK